VKRAEAKKPKSRIVTLRMDEDDFSRLDALARQTSFLTPSSKSVGGWSV